MAVIDADGIYQIGDAVTGSRLQLRKGHVVPDDVEIVKVGDWPEAKRAVEPENKADKAPENKAAKGDAKA